MPSLRERYKDLEFRITHMDPRGQSSRGYRALAKELTGLDDERRRAVFPPDEQAELATLSTQIHDVLERHLHEWQYPTLLSPQPHQHRGPRWGIERSR